MKKIIKLLTNYIIVLFFINFIPFAQNDSRIKFDLQNLVLHFNNLNATWKSNQENDYSYGISIKDYKLGFSEINIKSDFNSNSSLSGIRITGPTVDVNNFEINAKIYSENWITKEKIKRYKNREKIPRLAINKILEASSLYKIDNKVYPKNINELDITNYLEFDKYPFNDYKWIYSIDLPNTITAKPTHLNIAPESRLIIYNFQENDFQNNPLLDSLINVPKVEWNYSFSIQKIIQNLLSSVDISISQDGKNFKAEIIKGQFKMEDLQLSAIPGERLEELVTLKIPSIKFEINDFFFDGALGDFPEINRIKSNFRVRNFNLKLPEGLIEEPEIEHLFRKLGIWNNSFKIRLFEIDIDIINELTGIVIIKIHSPFLKIDIIANLIIKQNKTSQPKIILSESKIRINPIALGVRKYINRWEKENDKTLKRQGSIITLTVSGDIFDLFIQGLND